MVRKLESFNLNKKEASRISRIYRQAGLDLSIGLEIADLVYYYDQSREIIISALIYPLIENNIIPIVKLRTLFCRQAVLLAEAASEIKNLDLKSLPKKKKDIFYQLKVQSARRMLIWASKDIRVVLLKIVIAIIKLEKKAQPQWKLDQIAQSALLILAPLAERLMLADYHQKLTNYAFKQLKPKEYQKTKKKIRQYLASLSWTPKEIKEKIYRELKKEGLDAQIKSRIKSVYSVYQKLKSKRSNHDWVGFLIITRKKENCYQVLGLINRLFDSKKIKDYIINPKPNGYQSIHAIVQDQNGNFFEVQIRTKEMNQKAEFGPWAHWLYKEGSSFNQRQLVKELSWVRDIAKRIKKNQSKSMEELRINLFKDRIFVRSPKGEIIELPRGASVIDYAFHIHSDLGNNLSGAKVDGKLVKLNYRLKNGQKVEIIMDKKKNGQAPTRDWLEYVKTNKAKEAVSRAIKDR